MGPHSFAMVFAILALSSWLESVRSEVNSFGVHITEIVPPALIDVALEISSETPSSLCEGDCDTDNECDGELVCYQREEDVTTVPGCSGSPTDDWDYCIESATPSGTLYSLPH